MKEKGALKGCSSAMGDGGGMEEEREELGAASVGVRTAGRWKKEERKDGLQRH